MQISARTFWLVIVFVLLVGLGIVANPFVTSWHTVTTGILAGEGIAALLLIGYELFLSFRRDLAEPFPPIDQFERPTTAGAQTSASSHGLTLLLTVALLALWAWTFRDRWSGLEVYSDDSYYLGIARDWTTTRENLFQPYNEHYVVPQRLWTFAVARLGRHWDLPQVMQWSGALLMLPCLALVYSIARREWGSELAGLLAVTLFGLSTSYSEVLLWYSASLWLITFLLLLMSLRLCQLDPIPHPAANAAIGFSAYCRIAAACLISFLAPFSYSLGLLVGPLTTLWLAVRIGPLAPTANRADARAAWRDEDRPADASEVDHRGKPPTALWINRFQPALRAWALVLAPTLATIAWVILFLPGLLRWFETTQYLGNSSRESLRLFDPLGGIALAVRLSVDVLFIRNLGGRFMATYWWLYAILFAALIMALVTLLRRQPHAWGLAPMIGMIALPDALTLPFRTFILYDKLVWWTRYQMVPQLGLALLLTAFLHSNLSKRGPLPTRGLTLRQAAGLLLLAILLTTLHQLERYQTVTILEMR